MFIKSTLIISLLFCLPLTLFAGSADIKLSCSSDSGRTLIYGTVPGDSLDYKLHIKIDGQLMQYQNGCADAQCSRQISNGKLFVVNGIKKGVFTIAFTRKRALDAGTFYAIPKTIRYTKTQHGYRAQYRAVYYGLDPRSRTQVQSFIPAPVTLTCSHIYEI